MLGMIGGQRGRAQTSCLDYIPSNATAPKAMEGRSENAIKNHWNATMRRRNKAPRAHKKECAP